MLLAGISETAPTRNAPAPVPAISSRPSSVSPWASNRSGNFRYAEPRVRTDHPHCRCLTIDWSVWSGLGMGQRLGKVEELTQRGITPITPEEGVRIFRALVSSESRNSSIVVTGRYGDPPTLRRERPELPFAR